MKPESVNAAVMWVALVRWWWVVVLSLVVAGFAAYMASQAITPTYVSKAKVLVRGGAAPTNLSVGDIQAGRQLAENFADLIETRPVLERVVENLSLPYGPSTLDGKVSVHSIRSIIEIQVGDPDPAQAAAIANMVAEVFIINSLERQLGQIAQFQASLTQFGITDTSDVVASQAASLSALSVVEEALPASSPARPRVGVNVLIASILGVFVGVLIAYVLEHFEDSIRGPEALKLIPGVKSAGSEEHGLAFLGEIPKSSSGSMAKARSNGELDVARGLESYEYLSLNIEFSAMALPNARTYLVTSALPREGKTTTVSNLAHSVARSGKSVALVDCDLRRPAIHKAFGVPNSSGLTNALLGDLGLDDVLQESGVDGLTLLTSGPVPPDATIALRSPQMADLLKQLAARFDAVYIDTAPILAVADPLILAPLVDACLLVVDTKLNSMSSLTNAAQTLSNANRALLGVVFNQIEPNKGRSGYHYYRYRYENADSDTVADAKDRGFGARTAIGLSRFVSGLLPFRNRGGG